MGQMLVAEPAGQDLSLSRMHEPEWCDDCRTHLCNLVCNQCRRSYFWAKLERLPGGDYEALRLDIHMFQHQGRQLKQVGTTWYLLCRAAYKSDQRNSNER